MKPKYTFVKHPITRKPVASGGLYQIQALRDIPEFDVKRGDKGGFVSGPEVLSHSGKCWISVDAVVVRGSVSENAIIYSNVRVLESHIAGDAVLSGEAHIGPHVVVSGGACISGEATMSGTPTTPTSVLDSAVVAGKATVRSSHISGDSTLDGKTTITYSQIQGSRIRGNHKGVEINDSTLTSSLADGDVRIIASIISQTKITDDSCVTRSDIHESNIRGGSVVENSALNNTIVSEQAVVRKSALRDTCIAGYTQVISNSRLDHSENFMEIPTLSDEPDTKDNPRRVSTHNETLAESATEVVEEHLHALESIEEMYRAYTDDIVNVINYPVMTDMTDDYTRSFMKTLNKARRYAASGDAVKLADAVDKLEDEFMMAESNARKIKDTYLSEKHQKQLQAAKHRFAIALNDGATGCEREASFKSGMRSLRGVIDISDGAAIAMRGRIGLKELTA